MGSTSLATKYRPQKFEEIVEQDSIKVILENQVKTNNLKHAYLFCGSAGTGKTSSARIIAHMINNYETEPIELDCASHNGVDDVRAIIEDCKTRPYKGKYKVFLLDEIQMLTVQAWSAMLKILEEPPEYVIFLFCTTDPQKILGTILSRVQRFNFSRISNEGIRNRLKYIIENENNERDLASLQLIIYDDNAIDYIARLSQGGMRDSITTLEKCLDYDTNLSLENVIKVTSGGITEQLLTQFLCYMLNGQCKEALIHFNNIYMSGVDVTLFLKLWTEYLQNCVKYMITQTAEITKLSSVTVDWLKTIMTFTPQVKELLRSVLSIRTNFSADDMKIIIESWIIEKCN